MLTSKRPHHILKLHRLSSQKFHFSHSMLSIWLLKHWTLLSRRKVCFYLHWIFHWSKISSSCKVCRVVQGKITWIEDLLLDLFLAFLLKEKNVFTSNLCMFQNNNSENKWTTIKYYLLRNCQGQVEYIRFSDIPFSVIIT